jgi:hypothetical protein
VAVAAFYTAVHLIEQLRAMRRQGDSTSHEERLEWVRYFLPANIHGAYQILQNVSMLARYQAMTDFFNQFQPGDVQQKPIDERLVLIERYVKEQADTG